MSNTAKAVQDFPSWRLTNPNGVFSDWLKASCADQWRAVTHHVFTDAWGDAALPKANLENYLIQDHRFILELDGAFASILETQIEPRQPMRHTVCSGARRAGVWS